MKKRKKGGGKKHIIHSSANKFSWMNVLIDNYFVLKPIIVLSCKIDTWKGLRWRPLRSEQRALYRWSLQLRCFIAPFRLVKGIQIIFEIFIHYSIRTVKIREKSELKFIQPWARRAKRSWNVFVSSEELSEKVGVAQEEEEEAKNVISIIIFMILRFMKHPSYPHHHHLHRLTVKFYYNFFCCCRGINIATIYHIGDGMEIQWIRNVWF